MAASFVQRFVRNDKIPQNHPWLFRTFRFTDSRSIICTFLIFLAIYFMKDNRILLFHEDLFVNNLRATFPTNAKIILLYLYLWVYGYIHFINVSFAIFSNEFIIELYFLILSLWNGILWICLIFCFYIFYYFSCVYGSISGFRAFSFSKIHQCLIILRACNFYPLSPKSVLNEFI